METTERLGLPLLAPGQAQKELTHNEALQLIEILLAGAIEEPARNAPPSGPVPGSCYLVGSIPTGIWTQYAGHLAAFTSAGWRFVPPAQGMVALVKSSGLTVSYVGSAWEAGTIRAQRVVVDGLQVVGARAAAVADPASGSVIDAEARSALAQILSALRLHGLIAAA